MEVNQAATELLLKGTVADGLPEWDYGRPQPVKFIDFENPASNAFLQTHAIEHFGLHKRAVPRRSRLLWE